MSKRILIVGPPKSGKMTLVKRLTKGLPSSLNSSCENHSGLFHQWNIKTKYFKAEVPMWIDEFGSFKTSVSNENISTHEDDGSFATWLEQFTSDQAAEVRGELGAVVFTMDALISQSEMEDYIKGVNAFADLLDEEGLDVLCFLVSKGELSSERLELTKHMGTVEYENQLSVQSSEFNEPAGINRIIEAFENYPWSLPDSDNIDDEEQGEEDLEDSGPSLQLAKLLSEMKLPMLENKDVEDYEHFMEKLREARDNRDLTNDERKKLSEDLADELLAII